MVNFKVVELNQTIVNLVTKHEQELRTLNAAIEAAEKLEPEMLLADELHKRFCYHTDGCGYLYGSWKDPREEQRHWLNRAIRIMAGAKLRGISVEVFLELVDIARK